MVVWLSISFIVLFFFLFKQKTAYEMRISDWSSDVCSSDLHHVECYDDRQPKCDKFQRESQMIVQIGRIENHDQDVGLPLTGLSAQNDIASNLFVRAGCIKAVCAREVDQFDGTPITEGQAAGLPFHRHPGIIRSEEHTSELQSLMRIPY